MKGSTYENFWYCKKINFRQNCDTPSHAIFFNPEFFWNTRVPVRIFPVLWGKKVSRESRDNSLLLIKFFDKRMFLKIGGFPYEFFGTVRTSSFDKIVIHILMLFFYSRNFLKHNNPPTNFFGTVRQRSFERKSWYPFPIHKFFR